MTQVPTLTQLTHAEAQAAAAGADNPRRGHRDVRRDHAGRHGDEREPPRPPAPRSASSPAFDIVVSKGQERYAAPGLVGAAADSATATLQAQHLTRGERKEEFSETVAGGHGPRPGPTAGTSLKPGAAVAITVSKGRQPIPVADFTAKPADQAKKALTDAGLTVKEGDQVNSDSGARRVVVSQTPENGTLFKGDTVTIVVSKGPGPRLRTRTVGKQRDEATRLLKAAGVPGRVQQRARRAVQHRAGVGPGRGTMARKGATVTLTIV
jgi:serine/threonine-protein kinase